MAMNDTVADMLTRIRNGLVVNRSSVDVIASKLNRSVANVLERDGYGAFTPADVASAEDEGPTRSFDPFGDPFGLGNV